MIWDCRCGFRNNIDVSKINCKKSGYRVKCVSCGRIGRFKGLSPIRCFICKRNPYDYYYVNKSLVCVKCRLSKRDKIIVRRENEAPLEEFQTLKIRERVVGVSYYPTS